MQADPTMEELERLTDAEINAMENANPTWLRRFAKLRALTFFKRMKAAQEQCGV